MDELYAQVSFRTSNIVVEIIGPWQKFRRLFENNKDISEIALSKYRLKKCVTRYAVWMGVGLFLGCMYHYWHIKTNIIEKYRVADFGDEIPYATIDTRTLFTVFAKRRIEFFIYSMRYMSNELGYTDNLASNVADPKYFSTLKYKRMLRWYRYM